MASLAGFLPPDIRIPFYSLPFQGDAVSMRFWRYPNLFHPTSLFPGLCPFAKLCHPPHSLNPKHPWLCLCGCVWSSSPASLASWLPPAVLGAIDLPFPSANRCQPGCQRLRSPAAGRDEAPGRKPLGNRIIGFFIALQLSLQQFLLCAQCSFWSFQGIQHPESRMGSAPSAPDHNTLATSWH